MTLLTLESIEHFTRSTEHVTPPLTSMIMAVVEIPSDLMAAGVYLYRICQTKKNPHLIGFVSDHYVFQFYHGFRVCGPPDCYCPVVHLLPGRAQYITYCMTPPTRCH